MHGISIWPRITTRKLPTLHIWQFYTFANLYHNFQLQDIFVRRILQSTKRTEKQGSEVRSVRRFYMGINISADGNGNKKCKRFQNILFGSTTHRVTSHTSPERPRKRQSTASQGEIIAHWIEVNVHRLSSKSLYSNSKWWISTY